MKNPSHFDWDFAFAIISCDLSAPAPAADQIDQPDQDHCAADCHEKTVEIETGHASLSEKVHDEAADERACNADDDVGKRAHLAVGPHDKARDPARQRAKGNPNDDREEVHDSASVKNGIFAIIPPIDSLTEYSETRTRR